MADRPEFDELPQALPERRGGWSLQLVWLVPLVAALIGGWLAVRAIVDRGPTITIQFKTAEGLEPGKTRIKYKDVELGVIRKVTLSEDRAGVIATAEMDKQAQPLLVEDTRFWVVRARITGASVSGIGTLLSGSYVGMDAGRSTASSREFVGLEVPPIITSGVPGKQFVLKSEDIGSLDIGAPVYYRRLQAGQVIAYDLDQNGRGVVIKIFVNSPYDRYVNSNTRFWHASGIDVALDANGLKINTESLASVLVGGIAFQSPEDSAELPPVDANTTFAAYPTRTLAMRQPDTVATRYTLVFGESVRGLSVGAPVDFRGLAIGEVKAINVSYDRVRSEFQMVVEIEVYPDRLRRRYRNKQDQMPESRDVIALLIERGFRAQLRTANLLTGQLYVALDFFPNAPKFTRDASRQPTELPTMPGSLQELQTTIASIAKKVEKIPFEELTGDLRQTLRNADRLLQQLDKELAPEARAVLSEGRGALAEGRGALAEVRKTLQSVEQTLAADAPLQTDARDAMREVARAAQAFRVLADYLERHPEALLRGKAKDQP